MKFRHLLMISASALSLAQIAPANEELTDKNNTQELQDAQIIRDLNNVPAEAETARAMNPTGYCVNGYWQTWPVPTACDQGLRKRTYKANVGRAEALLLNYKAKAESELKDPFQTSFMFFLAAVAQGYPIVNDPREPDGEAGNDSVNEMTTMLSGMFEKILKVQAAMGSLKLDPQVTAANSVDYPDSRFEMRSAGTLKMANGEPAPGKDFAEKARNHLSQSFERMVRAFVAGSDQLMLDTGTPWNGSQKILGMYQGLLPDLLNSKTEDKVVPGTFYPGWAGCGIANMMNGPFKLFKSPDGQYKTETPASNHQCETGGGDHLAISRGDMVYVLMALMQKMQSDVKTKGKIISASSYNVLDTCSSLLAEIQVFRDQIKAERDEMYEGQAGQTDVKELVECAQEDGFQLAGLRDKKTMDGAQMRSCYVAGLQNRVEVDLMSQYLYCTWRSIAEEVIKRMDQALTSKNEFTPISNNREPS